VLPPIVRVRHFTCDSQPWRIRELRPVEPPKNTLVAFVKAEAPSGVVYEGCGLHVAGSRIWCSPPSIPWVRDGELVRDAKGRVQYSPIVSFANHGVRSRWSDQIVAAVRRTYPDLLPEPDSDALEAAEAARWFGRQAP
jgi:hypothetical protein